MTSEQFRVIQQLNENIEWLKNQHIPAVNQFDEYVPMKTAMHLLNRQRTWIQNRMVKEVNPQTNVVESLVRDVDWIREGNRVMFKKESLIRIKRDVLTALGNKYDNI